MMRAAGLVFMLMAGFSCNVQAEPIPPAALSANDKPDTLCGITAATVKAFQDKAATDKRYRVETPTERYQDFSSEELQALLTFVTPKHPAWPAAICRQVVDKGSVMALEMHIRCEAKASACEDFYWEQKKQDDGSGD
jgi:hypothetical protein